MDAHTEARIDYIYNAIKELSHRLSTMHTMSYDKICITDHHYWASHMGETIPDDRKCMCGKMILEQVK